MTVGEFQGLVATVGFSAAEAALNAAGGFSTPTPAATPAPTSASTAAPYSTSAAPNVEPASVSAFTQLERSGRKGTDLMERGNRRISMRDGSTVDTVADFFNNELNDEQKAFVNGWDGGIWTFASSAQDMTELKRNLNFHFKNAPETVGKEILQVDQSSTPVTDEGKKRMAFLNPETTTAEPPSELYPWDYGELVEGSSEYAIPSVAPTSINYPEFGVGSSDYATSSFLNALNALATSTPTPTPISSVDVPTDKEGDVQIRNGVPHIFTGGAWQPNLTVAAGSVTATPQTGQVPWDTMPANSLEQLLGKMNQGFYTTDSSGHYNSLSRLYRDAEAFLKSQGREPTDQDVYNAMGLIATNAAKQTDSTVADEYFWYDRNIEDWRNEGRPLRPGGTATAEITETILTDDEKRRSQAELIELFEKDSSVARADYDPTAAGTAATTEVPANLQDVFGTDANNSNNEVNESYNDWLARGAPGREELETILIDPSTVSGTGTGLPNLGGGAVLPGPTVTPFTTNVAGAEVGGPATTDIFGQMQTQENFPADVFRRFLAEQVSPSGEYQALSPFMMRGTQDLAPQLMSEYRSSIYDPSNWTDAGNQSTFGDWLRAGQRPTRQGMFNTLQNIGNVVSAGQQGLTAPGLSLGESLRRQNIINQFGTDTAESRHALQGLFSTAALRGVAPAFRYPVQSAAQNLFQTQRALQPEQSFLSFLGERL